MGRKDQMGFAKIPCTFKSIFKLVSPFWLILLGETLAQMVGWRGLLAFLLWQLLWDLPTWAPLFWAGAASALAVPSCLQAPPVGCWMRMSHRAEDQDGFLCASSAPWAGSAGRVTLRKPLIHQQWQAFLETPPARREEAEWWSCVRNLQCESEYWSTCSVLND